MHFLVIVAIPPEDVEDINDANEIEEIVDALMEPYSEHLEVDWIEDDDEWYAEEGGYWTNLDAFWDWYQIGGRWSGHLDGYDPYKDPANKETCTVCKGTGIRPGGLEQFGQQWFDNCSGCNGCHGAGSRTQWPTDFELRRGDWAYYGDVKDKLKSDPPYYLVMGEGVRRNERRNPNWKEGDDWGKYWISTDEIPEALEKITDQAIVVVVDCHS